MQEGNVLTAQDKSKQQRDALDKGSPVPSGRLSRMARFGGIAAGVAGNVLAQGASDLARGNPLRPRDLIMTPANARKVADQLARLRGAAMKVGQLVSMDAGDLLPPELSEIFARLRADAQPMPGRQLKSVLNTAWGHGWLKQFRHFEVRPIAAASIGQVHRAQTKDGRDLAIKVQYPGVASSINSDVDNVAALIRLSGVLPDGLEIDPLLQEAKRQLHEEADYLGEADRMAFFSNAVRNEPDIIVPDLHRDLTTPCVLAMTYEAGRPVESFENSDQARRNHIALVSTHILFKELFRFGVMQTDPNFANFFFDPDRNKLVLFDFGAAKKISPVLSEQYRNFLLAGLDGDSGDLERAADTVGFLGTGLADDARALLIQMMEMALEPLRSSEPFDFAESDLPLRMQKYALELRERRDIIHVPPVDVLYIQRKIGGVFLLASRLKARLHIRQIALEYL